MSSPIQNVTLVGGTGNVGKLVLERLSASKFSLQVLRRLGSESTFPAHIKVIDVDVDSVDALTTALKGQDAVISTLPSDVAQVQHNLIDASITAGVRRFIPSEYGCNLDNALARKVPVFATKVQTQEYLKEKAAAGQISYTLVYTGPFLDWALKHQFILGTANFKPVLQNDGNALFSATNVDTIARACVSILEHVDETKNRAVFLEDLKTSQSRLVELAKQAAPEKPWEVSHANLEEEVKEAGEQLANGNINFGTIRPFFFQAIFTPGYGAAFEKTDNELLGLGKSSEEDVVELFKKLLL